jgi:anti-anti-sigma factor
MPRELLVIGFEAPEWDVASADQFERLLAPAIDTREVIIDLSTVNYIDSTCLSKLVGLYRRRVVRHGYPPCHLVVATPAVARRLSVARLDHLWPIHKTLGEARAALGRDQQPTGMGSP